MSPITDHISVPSPGEYTTGAANVPGVPTYIGNASAQILFTFSTEGNGANVLFAIYEYNATDATGAYLIQSTGLTQAGEDWQTAATWTTTIYAKGLTAPKSYQFKVKAKNEAGVETAFSAYSVVMVPYIDLDFSPDSNTLSLEVTTGNVKISGLTVTAVGATTPGVYTIGYTLTRINTPATKANVRIAYGTNGTDYTNLTDTVYTFGDNTTRYDITISSPAYSTTYTNDAGTAPAFVAGGLVAGMMITINSSTFNSANNGAFRVISVSAGAITVENSAGVAETDKVCSANDSMTSALSIGGAISTLTASAAGTANSNKWSSCYIVGNSYYATLYIRVTPYDEATGGDAGDSVATTIAVDNRPLAVTIAEINGYSWDEDTTPIIVADMASVVCGSYLYYMLTIKDSAGAIVQQLKSSDVITGWSYEADHAGNPGVWTTPTSYGVPAQYAPPTITGNRIRYVVQTPLTQGQIFSFVMKQAEVIQHNI